MSTTGYVYILVSSQTDCIKIGGSDYPPPKRVREINAMEIHELVVKWNW